MNDGNKETDFIELVIKVPKAIYVAIMLYEASHNGCVTNDDVIQIRLKVIANSTPLPKKHGKLKDISKIDEDRIEKDNPVMYLQINGEYIEAISLEYLEGLPTLVEETKEVTNE